MNCLTSTNFVLHITQLLKILRKRAIQHTLSAKSEMKCEVVAFVFDIKVWTCDRTDG